MTSLENQDIGIARTLSAKTEGNRVQKDINPER